MNRFRYLRRVVVVAVVALRQLAPLRELPPSLVGEWLLEGLREHSGWTIVSDSEMHGHLGAPWQRASPRRTSHSSSGTWSLILADGGDSPVTSSWAGGGGEGPARGRRGDWVGVSEWVSQRVRGQGVFITERSWGVGNATTSRIWYFHPAVN